MSGVRWQAQHYESWSLVKRTTLGKSSDISLSSTMYELSAKLCMSRISLSKEKWWLIVSPCWLHPFVYIFAIISPLLSERSPYPWRKQYHHPCSLTTASACWVASLLVLPSPTDNTVFENFQVLSLPLFACCAPNLHILHLLQLSWLHSSASLSTDFIHWTSKGRSGCSIQHSLLIRCFWHH